MKKVFVGFMLFIGGLLPFVTIVNVSFDNYGYLHLGEFGVTCVLLALISVIGLLLSGYEAFFKKDN